MIQMTETGFLPACAKDGVETWRWVGFGVELAGEKMENMVKFSCLLKSFTTCQVFEVVFEFLKPLEALEGHFLK